MDSSPKPSLFRRLKIAYYKLISDRRRYLRVPLRVRVTNQMTDIFEYFPSTNISVGGMFISSESPCAVGTPVKLEFRIPTMEEKLVVEGKVVRIMLPNPNGHTSGMGIRFTELESIGREMIEEFIETVGKY